MAKADVLIVDAGGANVTPTRTYRTEAGATAILAGEPVKIGGTGSNYVIPLATAEPTNAVPMVGIAQDDSDQTASADGTVEVYLVTPGLTVLRAAATTPGNVDTDAELLAILNDQVAFDLIAGVYTIDEDQGTAATNGLIIQGGDVVNGTLDVVLQGTSWSLN